MKASNALSVETAPDFKPYHDGSSVRPQPAYANGFRWEADIVDYLHANGVTEAHRAEGTGMDSDIAGVPGVVIEAKNRTRTELAAWIDQAENERRGEAVAVVWHKRKGKESPGDGYVTMTGNQFLGLLRSAGYITDVP